MYKAEEVLAAWWQARGLWWQQDRQFDRECRRRWLSATLMASEGALDVWLSSPETGAALIILLDPLPRCIYRGLPLAYAADQKARSVCRSLIKLSGVSGLPLWQQLWLYQPLVNSEKVADQQLALNLYSRLQALSDGDSADQSMLAPFLSQCQVSASLIQRFGRFPQRNAILGRKSCIEECVYLAGITGTLEL
ncbi:MAG: DUF924 domain-containing protein [Hahellaceae bacterium]|nr:DUF924 domain-containing protein [Hahellaceae bacterium]